MAFHSMMRAYFARDTVEVAMSWWMWIVGALLLTAAIEALSARLEAQKLRRDIALLRSDVAELQRIIEHRLEEMSSDLSALSPPNADSWLSDIDPSEAP